MKPGDSVRLHAAAVVVRVENHGHGPEIWVELPQRDFTEPRLVMVDPDEVDMLERAADAVAEALG